MRIVNQNLFYSFRLKNNLLRLKGYEPDILCLQEFDRDKFDRIINNPFKEYHLILPQKRRAKTNCFISKLKPENVGELHMNAQGEIIQKLDLKAHDTLALWADFRINKEQIRIYNCHFEVDKIGFEERANMLKQVTNHTKGIRKILILGDMNTTIPRGRINRFLNHLFHKNKLPPKNIFNEMHRVNEKNYFHSVVQEMGFEELLDVEKNTWRFPFTPFEICGLKLDWVLNKNIDVRGFVEDKTPIYLDHKTIVADLIT